MVDLDQYMAYPDQTNFSLKPIADYNYYLLNIDGKKIKYCEYDGFCPGFRRKQQI